MASLITLWLSILTFQALVSRASDTLSDYDDSSELQASLEQDVSAIIDSLEKDKNIVYILEEDGSGSASQEYGSGESDEELFSEGNSADKNGSQGEPEFAESQFHRVFFKHPGSLSNLVHNFPHHHHAPLVRSYHKFPTTVVHETEEPLVHFRKHKDHHDVDHSHDHQSFHLEPHRHHHHGDLHESHEVHSEPHIIHDTHHKVVVHDVCDTRKPPKCARHTHTLGICFEDDQYPLLDIRSAMKNDHHFEEKYPIQAAANILHYIEEQTDDYDYSYYTGMSKGDSPYDVTHWTGPEGYICPSDIKYVTLKRARNVAGEWRVIINDDDYYTQNTRLEACLYPDSACRMLSPMVHSKCHQKFAFHRLLSFDPCDPYKGLFVDVFKLPSSCSCYIPNMLTYHSK